MNPQLMPEVVASLQSEDGYALARARALLTVYGEMWAVKLQDYEVIRVEHEFRFPLLNPETESPSRSFDEAGKIDLLLKHRPSGRVVVTEHKTTSEDVDPASDYWDRLRMENQISKYYLAALNEGHDVAGILYDVICKPALRPSLVPDLDADGLKIVKDAAGSRVYTKDGKKPRETGDAEKGYAVQGHTETPDEFEKRLLVALRAEPGAYFAQREVPRLNSDILEYMEDTWAIGQQILYARNKKLWPRNPQACKQMGTCSYFDLCCGRASVDGIRYKKRENLHSELTMCHNGDTTGHELLTHSRVSALRKCPRFHKLRYEVGAVESVQQDAEALRLGTMVHLGLERFFTALMKLNTLTPCK